MRVPGGQREPLIDQPKPGKSCGRLKRGFLLYKDLWARAAPATSNLLAAALALRSAGLWRKLFT